MASDEVLRKLSKLSQREREVLWLRCDGLDYKSIGEQLFISRPTVRYMMGRVYVKLELDQLPQAHRTKEIFETYCPILKGEQLPPPPIEPGEPEAVTDEVSDMVEKDEKALVVWQASRPPTVVTPPPSRTIPIPSQPSTPSRRGRDRPFVWLIAGLILGIALMLGGFLLSNALREDRLGALPPTLAPTSPSAEEVPAAATEEPPLPSPTPIIEERVVTQVVTSTPDLDAPTATARVEEAVVTQEVVVVVTATSPPTPTEPANTPDDTMLELGDWWKTNGVWLRVSEVIFRDEDIFFYLEVWNQTGGQLIFEWTIAGSFRLTDNTGHLYNLDESDGGDREQFEANEVERISAGSSATTFRVDDSYFYTPSVTDLYLTVSNLSQISFAQFHIEVPK